jgi:hypothetical protein
MAAAGRRQGDDDGNGFGGEEAVEAARQRTHREVQRAAMLDRWTAEMRTLSVAATRVQATKNVAEASAQQVSVVGAGLGQGRGRAGQERAARGRTASGGRCAPDGAPMGGVAIAVQCSAVAWRLAGRLARRHIRTHG